MRKIFLTFTVFAMIVSVTITAAHACVDIDLSNDISISQQFDDTNNNDSSKNDKSYDTVCGGCCLHHIVFDQTSVNNHSILNGTLISNKSDLLLSNPAYGLKRPPKI